jgi:predicted naringenin-chalcone synthase
LVKDILDGTKHTNHNFLPKGTVEDRGPSCGTRMGHYQEEIGALARNAAQSALDIAEIPVQKFTHLVTVSCTGFYAPGFDTELINQLKLPAGIARTHVGFMGCHGALNGLRVAKAYTDADPDNCVLVCAAELCSVRYHYGWNPQKVVANALFADGAAAVVGTSTAATKNGGWKLLKSGAYIFPDSADAMTWTICDHGFEMTLSKKVPELIQNNLRPWLSKWLAEEKMTIADVGSWAVHPGGPKILDAVENALQFPEGTTAVSREILAEYGNMSSPTLLFTIQRMQQYQARLPCVALGFGPGLAVEAALFG